MEPGIALFDVGRPLFRSLLERNFGLGHLLVEEVPTKRFEGGIKGVRHRSDSLFGELPKSLPLAYRDPNGCRYSCHTHSLHSWNPYGTRVWRIGDASNRLIA
jgi:hypothetical protein